MGAWDVSSVGRHPQGVTLIRLSEQETLVGLAKILSEADEEGEEEGGDEE
jgi:hypothetical protein